MSELEIPPKVMTFGKLCSRYSTQIENLQLLSEVARIGRDYCAESLIAVIELQGHKASPFSQRVAKYSVEQRQSFTDFNRLVFVRLTGVLDAFVSDVILFAVRADLCVWTEAARSKLKAPLIDYIELDDTQRGEYIYDLVVSQIVGGQITGVEKSEAVLSCVGLSGPVPSNVRGILFKAYKIRNCIVHNDSVVDRRLAKEVPELDKIVGSAIDPEGSACRGLLFAVLAYYTEIQCRVLDSLKWDATPSMKERDSYVRILDSEEYMSMSVPFGG